MILLIDNFDSFVHNLARYFERLGQTTHVVRNDAITPSAIAQLTPAAIVLSPGPCTPKQAGCSLDVVRQLAGRFPILGVCLGHQTIAAALGGTIIRANEPVHGRSSMIDHSGRGLFRNVPNPLQVGRYHSLVVDRETLPSELEITATAADGTIMGLAHRQLPLFGLQFHPESILTDCGYQILANFLQEAGLNPGAELPSPWDERPTLPPEFQAPLLPVTF